MVQPDTRNEAGTLLCICGKPQVAYSSRFERGVCNSPECEAILLQIEENNREFDDLQS